MKLIKTFCCAFLVFFWTNSFAQLYAPEIKVQDTGGNIGIGTYTPGAKLDVFGNIYVGSTDGLIKFRRSDGALNGYVGFTGNDLYMQNSSGSGVIKFIINNSPNGLKEVMRVDGSLDGHVGIGTTDPLEKLHVSGNIYLENNKLQFLSQYGNTHRNNIYTLGTSTTYGEWKFYSYYDHIIFNAGASSGNKRAILFKVGQSEIMRVNSTGNVGIGITSPSEKLHVIGNVLASNVNISSDRKLKKDIVAYNGGLELIEQIQPKKFKYKPRKVISIELDTLTSSETIIEKFEEDNRDYIGVIAQDIQQIAPGLVGSFTDEVGEETLTVNHTALIFILINAVKEQQALIETLQSKVKVLETK